MTLDGDWACMHPLTNGTHALSVSHSLHSFDSCVVFIRFILMMLFATPLSHNQILKCFVFLFIFFPVLHFISPFPFNLLHFSAVVVSLAFVFSFIFWENKLALRLFSTLYCRRGVFLSLFCFCCCCCSSFVWCVDSWCARFWPWYRKSELKFD